QLNLCSRETVLQSIGALSDWWKAFVEAEYARYRRLIGAAVDEFAANQQAAISGIEDTNPTRREAALFVLANSFDKNAVTCARCEELIETEPHDSVKTVAMHYIAAYYRNSKDPSATKRFAKLVASEKESIEVRRFAYWCMILVHSSDRATRKESVENLRFPNDL